MTCQVCGNRPSTDVMCNSRIYRLRGKEDMTNYVSTDKKNISEWYVSYFTKTSQHVAGYLSIHSPDRSDSYYSEVHNGSVKSTQQQLLKDVPF